MNCAICYTKIVIKRTIWTMFDEVTYHICDSCQKKYAVTPKVEVLPSIGGAIFVITLFNISVPKSISIAYMGHMDVVYRWFKKMNAGIVLFMDEVNDYLLEVFQDIDFGNILVITIKREKGEDYEI